MRHTIDLVFRNHSDVSLILKTLGEIYGLTIDESLIFNSVMEQVILKKVFGINEALSISVDIKDALLKIYIAGSEELVGIIDCDLIAKKYLPLPEESLACSINIQSKLRKYRLLSEATQKFSKDLTWEDLFFISIT